METISRRFSPYFQSVFCFSLERRFKKGTSIVETAIVCHRKCLEENYYPPSVLSTLANPFYVLRKQINSSVRRDHARLRHVKPKSQRLVAVETGVEQFVVTADKSG